MNAGSAEKMKITVDTETLKVDVSAEKSGGVVEVSKQEGGIAEVRIQEGGVEVVSEREFENIYYSENGFRWVATILYAHNSPGCVYIRIGGRVFRVCS